MPRCSRGGTGCPQGEARDLKIEGVRNRNRCFDGDVVIVQVVGVKADATPSGSTPKTPKTPKSATKSAPAAAATATTPSAPSASSGVEMDEAVVPQSALELHSALGLAPGAHLAAAYEHDPLLRLSDEDDDDELDPDLIHGNESDDDELREPLEGESELEDAEAALGPRKLARVVFVWIASHPREHTGHLIPCNAEQAALDANDRNAFFVPVDKRGSLID